MTKKPESTPTEIEKQIKEGKQALEMAKEVVVVENKSAEFASTYDEDRDLVNRFIGRGQILGAFKKIADVTSIMDWKRMKDSKAYQSLSSNPVVSRSTQKLVTVTTWASFCTHVIGVSRERADQQILNLEAFGADALDTMNKAGLGYRDFRKLRKLPEGDQQAIIGEVEKLLAVRAKILRSVLRVTFVCRQEFGVPRLDIQQVHIGVVGGNGFCQRDVPVVIGYGGRRQSLIVFINQGGRVHLVFAHVLVYLDFIYIKKTFVPCVGSIVQQFPAMAPPVVLGFGGAVLDQVVHGPVRVPHIKMGDLVASFVTLHDCPFVFWKIGVGIYRVFRGVGQLPCFPVIYVHLKGVKNTRFLAAEHDFAFVRGKRAASNLHNVHKLGHGVLFGRVFIRGGGATSRYECQ